MFVCASMDLKRNGSFKNSDLDWINDVDNPIKYLKPRFLLLGQTETGLGTMV